MAGGTDRATFAVELKDETSSPAQDAANALAALKKKIQDDTAALRQMNAALRAMKGATGASVSATKELKDRADAMKASIASNHARFVQYGGSFAPVARGTGEVAKASKGLLDKLGNLPGPLGSIVGRLKSLKGMLGGGTVGLIAAVTAALAAFAATTAGVIVGLLRYGFAQSNARRAELLRLEGLVSIRRWNRLAASSGQELQASIDAVNNSTGVGRGQLEGYAAQLHRMGLRGQAARDALEGMAITGAVQGEAMARRFASMAAGASRAGGSVRALADIVRSRLGGLAARRMLDLDVQVQRLRDNFGRIFGDLRIEGLLRALNEITSMFSQSSATGRALKVIVEGLFNPLFDAAGRGAPIMRAFLQGMTIGALVLTAEVLRLSIAFQRAFGSSSILRGLNAQNLALKAGIAVVALFVGALGAVAVVAGTVVAILGALAAGYYVVVASIRNMLGAMGRLVVLLRETNQAVGTAIVDGIVNGIRAGISRVRSAVTDVANAARGALESVLRIQSPSRVFAELGLQIPAGLAAGIEEGSGAAQDAADAMVTPTEPGSARLGGSTTHVSIEGGIHVHAQNGEQARDIAEGIREQLAEILEGLGLSDGVEVPT